MEFASMIMAIVMLLSSGINDTVFTPSSASFVVDPCWDATSACWNPYPPVALYDQWIYGDPICLYPTAGPDKFTGKFCTPHVLTKQLNYQQLDRIYITNVTTLQNEYYMIKRATDPSVPTEFPPNGKPISPTMTIRFLQYVGYD